ncbi:lysine decarboxylase [Photobacterium sp. 2_MG-2023]|uniref:lysine decarboxylase n=1 Tax=Photobacterium sp. 2_MG-2023 TaxID=3062663 RepID=UPI0026E1B521|nr:lysine decarboxylase [Photobacterium sp. 2_MG-2023]MDO6581603.1 lysine decarboxylase [Photobacterium sp. 2_MG-2023]
MVDKIRLPIYESLASSKKRMNGSFHALPIQNVGNIKNVILEEGFLSAFEKIKHLELSITGPFFDSLSDPSRVIDESSNIISDIYGSDLSLFVTCGSTIANNIVIEALCKNDDKVICQKGVHQSIHFTLKSSNIDVNFVEDILCNNESSIYRGNAEKILDELKNAEELNNPYKTLIINSQSYDGVCFDLSRFLDQVCQIATRLENIIIDEAWGAWSAFDPYMKEKSGIYNSKRLSQKYDKNFIVVHSIHKSLFSFRQASLINVYGSDHCLDKMISSHYRNHTTSPSYPILASTELAVVHAKNYGHQYTERTLFLIDKLKNFVVKNLNHFKVEELEVNSEFFVNDPTKIWITCSSPLLNGEKIREYLFNNQGVYISRYNEKSFLLNFHCGVTDELVDYLSLGLECLEKKIKANTNKMNIREGDVSSSFFILYPPGTPVLTPGQTVCKFDLDKINSSLINNISLLVVEGN